MSDDKKGWLHSDIYEKSEWPETPKPRTSIFKFGSFGDLIRNALKIVGQSIIAWFLFAMLFIFLLDPTLKTNDTYNLATGEIIKLVCITISVFLAVKVFDGSDIPDIGLKVDRQAFRDFLIGFTMVAGVIGIEFIIYLSEGWLRIENVAWATQSLANVVLNTFVLLVIFLFVGWSEELFSRGFHLRIISKGLNRPLGIILSSVYFSYLHHSNPDMTPTGYIFIFLSGLVFALSFLRTGQLWLAMGIHAGWDFFVAILWGTPISGLRLYHLMNFNISHFPRLYNIPEFIDLLIIVMLVYFYTWGRKRRDMEW